MLTDNLFCDQIKKLIELKLIINFDNDFDNNLKLLDDTIDDLYKSDNEDIEDFSDLISYINEICYNIYGNISKEDRYRLLQLRIKAKKQVKQKFRDYKYNNRKFWNHEEANRQYAELVECVWNPSVITISNMIAKYNY